MCGFFPLNKRQRPENDVFGRKLRKKTQLGGGGGVKENTAKNNDFLKEKMKRAAKKCDFL